MAGNPGAWGIDIGQAGLKAIRLEISDATEQVVATAFDYIAHPKILSQPDAIPEELISQALDKFLKQNVTTNDLIAISVPGQSALARFIQLPPVEASKVSEIVKYEARQQIPFALDDVVWDYQTLGKGTQESGFLLEAEVGLFAMKRNQVLNQLKPFNNAGVEVELIQISPLALYNFLSYDQLGFRIGDDAVSMDSYTILLDMGADNTTLLVSNGQKIWIRNVPIGGNHFTRALTKEMKLTFAKAEHLKCNATKSPDPRAVFQALRPVFNDYVSEIQRSIGYFSSVNRDAKISKVVGLGNGFKLAGLQKFLQQNLQYEVERIESFGAISSDGFKDAALFEENILSFPVCYGAALQALKQTRMRTTLLPREITTARTIARKKPWAVAAAAVLTLGLATSGFGYARVYQTVSTARFSKSEDAVKEVGGEIDKLNKEYEGAKAACKTKKEEGERLVPSIEKRSEWLELYKAIDECLPRDDRDKENPDLRLKNRLYILSVKPRFKANLAQWFESLPEQAKGSMMDPNDSKQPPSEQGYVITVAGFHFHDELQGHDVVERGQDPRVEVEGKGVGYIGKTFLSNLQKWSVPSRDKSGEVGVRKIGISHATVADSKETTEMREPTGKVATVIANAGPAGVANSRQVLRSLRRRDKREERAGQSQIADMQQELTQTLPTGETVQLVQMRKWDFVVEFVWTPQRRPQKPPTADAQAATPGAPAPGAAAPGAAVPAPAVPKP